MVLLFATNYFLHGFVTHTHIKNVDYEYCLASSDHLMFISFQHLFGFINNVVIVIHLALDKGFAFYVSDVIFYCIDGFGTIDRQREVVGHCINVIFLLLHLHIRQ